MTRAALARRRPGPVRASVAADSPPFLLDKENKALLAALIGLITAMLGAVGIADKFRFGQQPS